MATMQVLSGPISKLFHKDLHTSMHVYDSPTQDQRPQTFADVLF